jgi:aminopeptidase N
MDEAPGGVGDVGFSEASDFSVHINAATEVEVVSSANISKQIWGSKSLWMSQTKGIRDLAILASDQFVIKSKLIEISSKQVMVGVFVTKKHEAKADEVLSIAANALQIYSKRFGPYPYNSFKVVEGPMRGGAGGMEFSGMVSIASFLFDDMDKQMQELGASLGVGDIEKTMAQLFPEQAAENGAGANANPATEMLGGLLGGQKAILDSLLEQTIAHETAHQWWAMAVGSDAQRAPWVDESLTNYSTVVYFGDRYGQEKAAQMMDLHLKGTYSTGRMMGGADAPVNLSTAAYQNNVQYGAVVYGKGALYYDALRKLVGDENFFAALRAYFQKYNGKIAPARGLLAIMKQQAPGKADEIETLFHHWIEETHGDEDIAGGKISGVQDLLGGLLGGMMGGMEQ